MTVNTSSIKENNIWATLNINFLTVSVQYDVLHSTKY